MERRKKALVVHIGEQTFVKADVAILSKKFEVSTYYFKPFKKPFAGAIQYLKQFFFLFFNIYKFQVIYIWFGDYHTLLPVLFAKLFGKKSFVVIGGYDVTSLPEFKYGSLYKPLRRKITYLSFKHATLCLPVVEKLEEKLKDFCPTANSQTVYTGYDFSEKDKKSIENTRSKSVLTVSITPGAQRIFIKGLDRFKELAEKMPDFEFTIVGVKNEAKELFEPIPKNLILLAPQTPEQLIELYEKSSFYAQFSRTEGLPNALCEGMLYGCIPLGVNIGGIPTAIGEFGLVTDDWDLEAFVAYIREWHGKVERFYISEFITKQFSLEKRVQKILHTV